MDSRAADLDRDDGIEDAHGGLEGLEVAVLVGEDAELVVGHAEADPGVHVLLRGLEPGIALRLAGPAVSARGDRGWREHTERAGEGRTCLKMWWRKAS